MVDPDVLRRRTDQVLHHLRRLRDREDLSVELLERDEDIMSVVLMDLQRAIQGCIDLAVHACVDDGLGAPEGPAAAFALLARAGRIGPAGLPRSSREERSAPGLVSREPTTRPIGPRQFGAHDSTMDHHCAFIDSGGTKDGWFRGS